MVYNFLISQKMSDFLRKTIILHIVCLISKILQMHFLPNATNIRFIIEKTAQISFLITALAVIPLTFKFIKRKYPTLINKNRLLWITIVTSISTFFIFILHINHRMEFYIHTNINHHPNIIYLITFVVTLLFCDLLYSIKQYKKHKIMSLDSRIYNILRVFGYKYFIVIISYIKAFNLPELRASNTIITTTIKSLFMIYVTLLFCILLALWLGHFAYYLYYFKKNGNKK